MRPETKRRMYILTIGEFSTTIITILVTLGFLESGLWSILRNVIIADILFLLLFLVLIGVFHGYERLYKFGLGPEE